jgi:hypothetical protein
MSSPPLPTVFQAGGFAKAMEVALAKEGWVIVSVTVPSDALCRAMDDKSWRSPTVVAWIERRAVAVQLSIATEREVARTLNVRAAPTAIAIRAGKQEDRIVGFRDATELSEWLDALEKRTTKPDGGLRHSAAKIALDEQRYGDATTGYVWLWNNIPGFDNVYEVGWMGVRQSGLADEVGSLVRAHPPARLAFAAIRDASGVAAPALDLGDWFGPRVDWLLLNRVLGEPERTLEWFDGVKADPRYASVLEHGARLMLELLEERQRWADIGRLFADPLARLEEAHARMRFGAPDPDAKQSEMSARLHRLRVARFHDEVAVLYAGLRAAGRRSDAKALRTEALRRDPSEEMRRALDQAPGSEN